MTLDATWAALIGAIGGAAVGAAAGLAGPWIAHRARGDPLRQELYRRQMDAIDELLKLIQIAYHDALRRTFAEAAERAGLSDVVRENDKYWVEALIKRGHYLPNNLLTALNHFRVAMLNVAFASPTGLHPTNEVDDAYRNVSREIRAAVGVDAMSEDLSKLFQSQKPISTARPSSRERG